MGDGDLARSSYERGLALQPPENTHPGFLHQIASIDLNQGRYDEARAGFDAALRIRRAIGDRAGEAAGFFQLGSLARGKGQGRGGASLIAICWLINQSIDHGDAESDLGNLLTVCQELGLDEEGIKSLVEEAASAYVKDRGDSLIRQIFDEPGGRAPGDQGQRLP
jgi:hypothetical protein